MGALLLVIPIGQSCTTAKTFVENSVETLTGQGGMEVVVGEVVSHPSPLPDYYPLTDKKRPQVLIAKGWDINKDGQLDQIEILDLDGQVMERLFDFDGDGQIDLRQQTKKTEKSLKSL